MIKRINYTGRRRINRRHIDLCIRADGDEPPTFDARLTLNSYDLPASARVFVEAYRQTYWQRFDFGTVGDIKQPDSRQLTAFGSVDAVLFRVKVVEALEANGDGRPARILCHADRIRPRMPDERQTKSLLPLGPGDFRDEVWQLEFDETGEPILKISCHLIPDWRALPATPVFATLALPEIFRSILTRIVMIDKHTSLEDESDWRTQWLRFAVRLPGVGSAPPNPEDEDDAYQWLDGAVGAFCRRVRIAARFRQWYFED